jgi:hypothetical protein
MVISLFIVDKIFIIARSVATAQPSCSLAGMFPSPGLPVNYNQPRLRLNPNDAELSESFVPRIYPVRWKL